MLTHADTKHQNGINLINLKLGCSRLSLNPRAGKRRKEEGYKARTIWWCFHQLNDYPEGLIWMDACHPGKHLVTSGPREKPCNFLEPAKEENMGEKEKGL